MFSRNHSTFYSERKISRCPSLNTYFVKLCSIKRALPENFPIFRGKHQYWSLFEILFWRTPAYGCFWSDFINRLSGTFFLNSHFQNQPDLVIIQKYLPFPNQSFKQNPAHIPSLSLTPTLSFEHWFRMFIINSYDRKSKSM